jgi:hypothetical protein
MFFATRHIAINSRMEQALESLSLKHSRLWYPVAWQGVNGAAGRCP